MAAYRKQREHALGGGHITTPDELEKNGQPQNEKMKFESSKHETKLSMKLTAQVQARILSKTRRVCQGPNNKINEQTNKLKMKTTNDERRRKETDGKETPKPATEEDKNQEQYDTAAYVFTFV